MPSTKIVARFLLFLLLPASFILTNAARPQVKSPSKPNVLFIAIDDLNDWVGFMEGYAGKIHTPNLDRLANRGTAFTNAHTASPVCCPSRVAVMTGQLPSTSGIYSNRQQWKPNLPEIVTIPVHFRENGYATVGAGKIFHHPAGNNPPYQWDDFQRLDFHDDAFARTRRDLFPYAKDEREPEDFPFSGIELYSKEIDWAALEKPESEFDDARTAQYGIDFLEGHSGDEPFFLACGFFRPHMPWYFPKKYLDLYPLDSVAVPPDLPEDLDDVPEVGRELAMRKYVDMKKTRDAGKWRSAVQHYLCSTSFMDAQVGKLLDALDRSPFSSNTVIVLWSDHGWHLGEKQHWHKRTLWEESTRVPLIVVAPGTDQENQTCSQPASLVDLFPTLIELCSLPTLDSQTLDGVSLVPWLIDPKRIRDLPAITVHELQHISVRNEMYRLIQYNDGSRELYETFNDPNEWENLIGNPEHSSVTRSLASHIPINLAKSARSYTQFKFDPHTYRWSDKENGAIIDGGRK